MHFVHVAQEKNIKIAVTTDENKNVYGHFGSATLFTVYTIEDGKLVEKKEVEKDQS